MAFLVSWALIIIYLILPLLSRIRGRLKYCWFALFVVGVLLQCVSYFYGKPIQKNIIQTFRIWTWLQYFILGGLIGSGEFATMPIIKYMRYGNRILLGIGTTTLAVIFQYFIGDSLLHDSHAEYFYDSIIVVLWMISLFNWILKNSRFPLNAIRFVTPLMMGIYIIHPLLCRMTDVYITISSLGVTFAYFASILGLSVAIAFILFRVRPLRILIEL